MNELTLSKNELTLSKRLISEQLLSLYSYQWCPLFKDLFDYIFAPSPNEHKQKQQEALRIFVKEYFKEVINQEM